MEINKYKHDDWIVYFSGDKWAPIGFSSWLSIFTRKPFSKEFNYFVKQAVMVWDGKVTTCYIRESERKIFGEKVVKKAMKSSSYIDFICKKFRSGTDILLSIYSKKKEKFNHQDYIQYNSCFLNDYYQYHIQVKNIVDFLPKKVLGANLQKLQSARIHAEPVFSCEIKFMKKIAKCISNQSNYKIRNILFSFVDEITAYWRDKKSLPKECILQERGKGCVIFFENGKIEDVLVGKEISKFGSIFLNKKNDIIGQVAFGGRVSGVVRIVFDPTKIKQFNNGDILVAPWTRPEYLPIMKKAGAFVTDGGGILSHAAIVARELKKPCVIGTKIATSILHEGDLVEVDAIKGVVKKIKK
ncbi:MAG: PEP-utilizing enzyme [Planctomycetes bacterium]|jgi:phosphohistidine swiveling domain-containing protein|nr:PEP-utilizing enzyme [Planctomycetota bacterium]